MDEALDPIGNMLLLRIKRNFDNFINNKKCS